MFAGAPHHFVFRIKTAVNVYRSLTLLLAKGSRSAAGVVFAELTIGVDGAMPVGQAHDIADAVELRLQQNLGLDHVVVHIEPC